MYICVCFKKMKNNKVSEPELQSHISVKPFINTWFKEIIQICMGIVWIIVIYMKRDTYKCSQEVILDKIPTLQFHYFTLDYWYFLCFIPLLVVYYVFSTWYKCGYWLSNLSIVSLILLLLCAAFDIAFFCTLRLCGTLLVRARVRVRHE